MGKVKYNKNTKYFERRILINGVSILISFPKKKYLEELPYRINSANRFRHNKKGGSNSSNL
jgi:hypothetical protein